MPTSSKLTRRHWLLKTEPTSFSFDDLWNSPGRATFWSGVRNFQARNLLRDEMQVGDKVFIYHSSADPTGIVGVAEVAKAGYPDPTAFDAKDDHFDPKSKKDDPTWYVVDVKAVKRLPNMVTLERMRGTKELENMVLLKRGSRLSVQPVSEDEWDVITRLSNN